MYDAFINVCHHPERLAPTGILILLRLKNIYIKFVQLYELYNVETQEARMKDMFYAMTWRTLLTVLGIFILSPFPKY